jgi:hypothetical protein
MKHATKRQAQYLLTIFLILLAYQPLKATDAKPHAEFEDTRMRIEFNSTDQDVGVQVNLDADAWKRIKIISPTGQTIFSVEGQGRLRNLGMSELFFESEEPTLDELSFSELFARFPEGNYQFIGTTVDGEEFTGTAVFTHNVPDGPHIISPKKSDVLDPDHVVIHWDPVTTPAGIQIFRYQVIIETGNKPPRTFQVDLPSNVTTVKVPIGFLLSGKKYKFEVLAIEKGGNQTISVGGFNTK